MDTNTSEQRQGHVEQERGMAYNEDDDGREGLVHFR